MTAGSGTKRSAKKPPTLIERAIVLVKGFNPATQTSDSYADDALKAGGHQRGTADVINAAESMFLKQVQQQV